ncbi:MAG: 2-dehydropantoate 2-reductase [Chloroflexi bacterium]|nr:2-dehydropantoate 2-reductase [Chloroflexota bacterium]
MRYIIYGAGAVGGVIGGRLAEHGHDVVLIARGAHLAAIRARGLELQSPNGSITLPIPAAGHPSEIEFRDGDLVMLAMKTQDTQDALTALEAAAGNDVPLLCCQNGIENERLALRRFANVYTTAVMLPATHLEPGIVQANSSLFSGILDIGRYPSGVDETATAIASALAASNFSANPEPNVMRRKYTKLLLNLGNAIGAICGEEHGPAVDELGRRAREEALACYAAARIDFASDEEDRRRREGMMKIAPIAGQRRGGGSTWQSLQRGKRRLEVDYLNGEIVLIGRTHGVPTPTNEILRREANRLAREGLAPGALKAADLLAHLA